MPTKFIVYPYTLQNSYARDIANGLNTHRVRSNGLYVPQRHHVVICWGKVPRPTWNMQVPRMLNANSEPNKLFAFRKMLAFGVSIPPFACVRGEAQALFTGPNSKVVCRTQLSSFEGRGIVMALRPQDLVEAPLYVKYIPKEHEYRFHVMGGEVIDVTRKRLRNGAPEERNKYICNTGNGWIFSRRLDEYPEQANTEAINAVRALGLDFGAVDLVISSGNGRPYVLEVNTAPGVEGTTVTKYVESFRRIYGA